jgi:threonine/homoserine/homoserine lactone efflux protein
METYLFMGMVLGLSAGLSPGPLLALVISETIGLGIRAGIRVALAPLISDIPVLIVSFLLVSGCPAQTLHWVLYPLPGRSSY